MNKVKLYLYNKNTPSTGIEISSILLPIQYTETLNGEIDTMEITITKSSKADNYLPGTRFNVVVESTKSSETIQMVVRNDTVEKDVLSSENFYTHKLSLGNPAVELQQRTCENFSMTYKLEDVSLAYDSIRQGIMSPVMPKYGLHGNFAKDSRLSDGNYKWEFYHSGGIGVFYKTYEINIEKQKTIFTREKVFTKDGTLKMRDPIATDNYEDIKNSLIYDNGIDAAQLTELDNDGALFVKGGTGSSAHSSSVVTHDGEPYYRFYLPIFQMFENDYSSGAMSENDSFSSILDVRVRITDYDMISRLQTESTLDYTMPRKLFNDTYGLGKTTPSSYFNRSWYRNGLEPQGSVAPDTTYTSYTRDVIDVWEYDGTVSSDIKTNYNFSSYTFYTIGNFATDVVEDMSYVFAGSGQAADSVMQGLKTAVGLVCKNDDTYCKTYFDNNDMVGLMENCGFIQEIQLNPNHQYTFRFEPIFRDCNGNVQTSIYAVEKVEGKLTFKSNGQHSFDRSDREGNKFSNIHDPINSNQFYKEYTFAVLGKEKLRAQFFESSQPLTALDLFNKIRTTSQSYDLNVYGNAYDALANTKIIENIYYNKNCWEMIQELGKYLHAKPIIKFDEHGTDGGLELDFRYYGNPNQKQNQNSLNSIFTSQNVQDYICELDAYTSNLFQYGNEIYEYIKPQENDGTQLVVTDNAVLKTKYPILEILSLEFEIVYGANANVNNWYDITKYIYEHNIYKCLPIKHSASFPHAKSNSIYYHLGGTEIQGLQYKAPEANSIEPYAIKNILSAVSNEQHITNCVFRIKYRTKDNLRVPYLRPDIRKYLYQENATALPRHTQFTNQSDKYLDSQKYGDNCYGNLIRTGNREITTSEWQTSVFEDGFENRIKAGDLISQRNQPYYVASVTTFVYPEHIEQQINYTLDHNALSQVVGIDSEPRFYEISEQSNVDREILLRNVVNFGELATQDDFPSVLPSNYKGIDFIDNKAIPYLLSTIYSSNRPNYAKITINYEDENSQTFMLPVNNVASGHTFVASISTEDNYNIGDSETSTSMTNAVRGGAWLSAMMNLISGSVSGNITDNTYKAKEPNRYTDRFGKVKSVEIRICQYNISQNFDSHNLSIIEQLPKYNHNMDLDIADRAKFVDKDTMKDSRETLKYNMCMCAIADSDRYVISTNVFMPKITENGQQAQFRIALFEEEINKFSKNRINQKVYAVSSDNYNVTPTTDSHNIELFDMQYVVFDNQIDWSKVKSIALIYDYQILNGYINTQYIIAKNVGGLTDLEKQNTKIYASFKLPTKKHNQGQ